MKMIFDIARFLFFYVVAISSTPIPRNCTLSHSAKSVLSMWTCPEGTPTIWRQQLCDKFFNCRRSLADEKICVDYGPVGSSNLTFTDEKIPVGHSATPVVPRIYVPDFDCAAPLCVSEQGDIDLVYKAHLICRQMARTTFQRLALVSNDEKRWPIALSPKAVQCTGHEETIQQCSNLNSMKPGFLVEKCPNLLAVTCVNECAKEFVIEDPEDSHTGGSTTKVYKAPAQGILTSPGFPDYFLPHLDCTWTFTISNKRRVFALNLTVLNLQEFDVVPVEDADGPVCANSYIEIGLGVRPNGSYTKIRMCKEESVGVNLTSFGNRIYVRYVSGQYLGTVVGEKGFALSYRIIDASIHGSIDQSVPLSPPVIVLIALVCVISFVVIFGGTLYCFNRSKFRARRIAKRRRSEMVDRLNDNFILPLLRAPNRDGYFTPPVTCATCHERMRHIADLCPHYARLLHYVTDVDDMELARRSVQRARHRSHNSNVTIDIDDLMKADYEFRKQQKRWRSMDLSCIDSSKTALPFENSFVSSYTARVASSDCGSEYRNSDGERGETISDPSPRRFNPHMATKNAASAVRNFLTASIAKKPKSSFAECHTPEKTARIQCPKIAISEVEDNPVTVLTAFSLTPSPCAHRLSVSPVTFRSA